VANVPVDPDVLDPLVDDPEVLDPLVDDPLVDDPLLDEPEVDEPLVDDPDVDEPLVDDPDVDDVVEPLVVDGVGSLFLEQASITIKAMPKPNITIRDLLPNVLFDFS